MFINRFLLYAPPCSFSSNYIRIQWLCIRYTKLTQNRQIHEQKMEEADSLGIGRLPLPFIKPFFFKPLLFGGKQGQTLYNESATYLILHFQTAR